MNKMMSHFYEFGPFCINAAKRLLLRDGEVVTLAPKAFDTLLASVQYPGEVLEKDKLMQILWPDSDVEEANLPLNISVLRKALGESPSERRYIVTVPGRGYRFAAEVVQFNEAGSELMVKRYTKSTLVIEEQDHEEVAYTETKPSLAILPFKQLDAQGSDESLRLGIADTLVMKLSNLRGVLVRSTSSILKYSGQNRSSVEIGRELRVEYLLEGSLRRSGDRIRVTVQLVRVQDGSPLWARKFDEKFTDIFSVEDSISEQVADWLVLRLNGEEREVLAKRYTENVGAYQLYLKGLYHFTRKAIGKSVEYFQQAVEMDSNYALAYSGLATSLATLPMGTDAPSAEVLSKAKLASAKALELDDTLAEAHIAQAFIKFWIEWDWAGAERECRRAIELNPNHPLAHWWYAHYLSSAGRHSEAILESKRAVVLDPVSPLTSLFVGQFLYHARRYNEAIGYLNNALEIVPHDWVAHLHLGRVYVQEERYDEAIAEFQRARELSGGVTEIIGTIGDALALSGKAKEARKLLYDLKERSKQKYVPPYNLAMICAGLGHKDQALHWLEKGFQERDVRLVFLKVEPKWDNLRTDPRFASILHRIGLLSD